MKNLTHLFLLAFIFTAVVFSGCKKDKTAPVVTLKGDSTVEIALNGTYQEPGYTATDDEDGDLTGDVTVTGSVDKTNIGTYTLTYTVTDEAGNTGSVSRTVIVKIMQENWVGSFAVGDDCGGLIFISSTQSVSAGASAVDLSFSSIFTTGGTLVGTISGQTVTFASQQIQGSEVSGSGTINDNASVIILQLTFTPLVGSDESCTLTYTRN
ncbi:MAG: DUF5011 domain-containing protein [Bacteroidia bacterium]|nr:DUF5011 domain-containing protein [Bacteroidia bacterium]